MSRCDTPNPEFSLSDYGSPGNHTPGWATPRSRNSSTGLGNSSFSRSSTPNNLSFSRVEPMAEFTPAWDQLRAEMGFIQQEEGYKDIIQTVDKHISQQAEMERQHQMHMQARKHPQAARSRQETFILVNKLEGSISALKVQHSVLVSKLEALQTDENNELSKEDYAKAVNALLQNEDDVLAELEGKKWELFQLDACTASAVPATVEDVCAAVTKGTSESTKTHQTATTNGTW
eukprot:TRINITY_DN57459_c0_g1_i1.p1 TRINITY_DN57459_c0_g1~~TRINITY_DN57459_c0_g1_i1.p1  ORF type:complete len:232 (+),score=30.97 TRINITY_DN57459_c0_g1_i1:59-754(+)